ncbi:MAG: glycosyl hydrolase [Acidobacteriaceae bacterium]
MRLNLTPDIAKKARSTRRLHSLRPHGTWAAKRVVAAFAVSMLLPAARSQQINQPQARNVAELYQDFISPPNNARPMVRWWWFGVAVEKPEILRELQQMKADGIGGVELAFVYPQVLNDPARGLVNLPFLSPTMLEAVAYAQSEVGRLGLRVDVTLCSGWPYGGPSVSLEDAAGHLRTIQVPLDPNDTTVLPPRLSPGDSMVSIEIANGRPGHWDAASARPLQLEQGTVHLKPTDTARTALFFIASHTRQQVKRAAVGAEGYVLDPFSHQAVSDYLKSVGRPLVGAFGDTPPYAIFSDSLEAYGADWTPNLPAEFLKRRGYDLIPHLPELLQGGSAQAQTVRHDYGKTLTELVNENYLEQMTAWAVAHHTRFRSQTYGTPAVSFTSQNLASLAEGEGPQWRSFSTLRWATSANHVFGHDITSGETFTWLHSPVFRATPLDMKAEADIDLITGENQFVFHGWPYSSPQVGQPGWSLYAAAALNNHNPWHPVMPYVTRYLTRLSYLLRQGEPANQVAVLLPTDDAWAGFSPGKVSVTDAMKTLVPPSLVAAILSAGYNLDFTNAEAIQRVGFHHQILVLPPTDRIPQDTLDAIATYASHGGKVIAVGRIPSISPEGQSLKIPSVCDQPAQTSSCHPMFETAAGSFVTNEAHLGTALRAAATPDLQLISADAATKNELGFIRRKLPFADLYYVVNTGNRLVQATANFATTFPFAEQWNPDSTVARAASSHAQAIQLAPYESRIFIFSNKKSEPSIAQTTATIRELADLSNDWHLRFVSTGQTFNEPTPTDWTTSPATLHYSGEVIYKREINGVDLRRGVRVLLKVDGGKPLPGMPNSTPMEDAVNASGMPNPLVTHTGPGMRAYYDAPIREAALVMINGHCAGALWHPPYTLDVTKYLKPGKNLVEFDVYNTALNAWSALPPHNYKPLIAKYGDRFQMQDLDKVKPISSGLLGSVKLVSEGQP